MASFTDVLFLDKKGLVFVCSFVCLVVVFLLEVTFFLFFFLIISQVQA